MHETVHTNCNCYTALYRVVEHCGLGLRWCNVLTSSALAPRYSVIAELRMNPIERPATSPEGPTTWSHSNTHSLSPDRSSLILRGVVSNNGSQF